jgi:hypothetical protein
MESTSEAMKIQCSSSTASLLDTSSHVITVPRGTIDVKGKGLMSTYWIERIAVGGDDDVCVHLEGLDESMSEDIKIIVKV